MPRKEKIHVSSFPSRDQDIRSLFDFISYASPTDSVSYLLSDTIEADDENYDTYITDYDSAVVRDRMGLKEAKRQKHLIKTIEGDRFRRLGDAGRNPSSNHGM